MLLVNGGFAIEAVANRCVPSAPVTRKLLKPHKGRAGGNNSRMFLPQKDPDRSFRSQARAPVPPFPTEEGDSQGLFPRAPYPGLLLSSALKSPRVQRSSA